MDPWVIALIVMRVVLELEDVVARAVLAAQERREGAARMAYQLGAPETAERILRQGKQE